MLMSDPPASSSALPERQPALSWRWVAALWAAILAVASGGLGLFYGLGVTDIYGDALAHMEGARRLFDSLTPGYPEIGSVWLPLYHIIVAPLAQNDFLWRSGLAGSLVSITCFTLTAWVLFRLAMEMNASRASGIVALAGFLLCPSMIYLASEPMTEPMAELWAVFAVYLLFRYQHTGEMRPLVLAGAAAFLGALTRYGEWYVLPFAALFVVFARKDPWSRRLGRALLFSVIAGAGPALWIAHNAYRFGNPIEFYNGPFSAQAIYAHQLATTGFRYPTDGSLLLSARYYLEDLKMVIGPWPLELAALGLIAWAADRQARPRRWAALLLLAPLPFYAQAMAHAAVGLYVPTLFPYTYYNLRYGLEMLPALALLPSFVISPGLTRPARVLFMAAFLTVIVAQSLAQFSGGLRQLPIVQESILNTPCRRELEQGAADFLLQQYDGQRVLMAAGKWPCLAPEVGIHYRNILTENNRPYWRRLRFGAGPWVEWIIRRDGDAVDELMRAYPAAFRNFEIVKTISAPGQGSVLIYRRVGR
jgi:hypothetical protein